MRKLIWAVAAIVTLSTTIFSCKDTYIDPAQSVFVADTNVIVQYAKAQSLSVTAAEFGVRYAITQANPTGKKPAEADELDFFYTLSTLDGRQVDVSRRDTAVYFQYGLRSMLPGLEVGFSKMREGEKAVFLVPSYAAFGTQPAINNTLPANTPVRFDVTLNKSRSEDEQIENFVLRNKYTVADKQTNGLRIIKTTAVPAGPALIDGQTVTVKYSGRQLRATKAFDSGTLDVALGRTGQNQPIAGFEAGIKAFKVGEKGVIVFPSSLGYGANPPRQDGYYVFPPYSPLAFDVEIVSAR